MSEHVLSDEQIQHFIEYGFIQLSDCFDTDFAAKWIDEAFVRLGYDPNDPSTWEKDIVHMPSEDWVMASEFAPKAWRAICQLLGGEERVRRNRWGNGFVVNFSLGADREWMPPSPAVGGWHKDGNYFYHYLDSPEQALLLIVIWKDIQPQAGGTFIACDSIKPVAQYLLEHREGIHPSEAKFGQLITLCKDFREITGKAGDVVLMHPHASSQNPSGIVRFMTNPSVTLREPMNFNRNQPEDHSPVEKAVLYALGVEQLNFQIEGERRRLNDDPINAIADEKNKDDKPINDLGENARYHLSLFHRIALSLSKQSYAFADLISKHLIVVFCFNPMLLANEHASSERIIPSTHAGISHLTTGRATSDQETASLWHPLQQHSAFWDDVP